MKEDSKFQKPTVFTNKTFYKILLLGKSKMQREAYLRLKQKIKYFYWSIVDFQNCISLRYTAKWLSFTRTHTHTHTHIYVCIFIQIRIYCIGQVIIGFPYGASGKEPASQCRRVQSLGRDDPLGEGTTTHTSILAWRIPWTEEPGVLVHRGQAQLEWLSTHACTHRELYSISCSNLWWKITYF